MRPRLRATAVLVTAVVMLLGSPGSASGATYVSLGDSYASGEGAGAYERSSRECHRSPRAWPRLMGVSPADHLACSGAKVVHVLSRPQHYDGRSRRAQLVRLQAIARSSEIDTVLLTIGGNDLGFARKLAVCRFARRDCLTDRAGIDRELAGIAPKLTRAYQRVYASARARRLAVVGYPDVIPDPGEAAVRCQWLKAAKRENIEYLQRRLDETLARASAAAGAIYVSVRDALRDERSGHELCTRDSWMYPILSPRLLESVGGIPSVFRQQAHPTEDGQRALAVHVRAGLRAWQRMPGAFCSESGPDAHGHTIALYAHLVSCATAGQVRREWSEAPDHETPLEAGWRCRGNDGTAGAASVTEVRCENNGRFVRWTSTYAGR